MNIFDNREKKPEFKGGDVVLVGGWGTQSEQDWELGIYLESDGDRHLVQVCAERYGYYPRCKLAEAKDFKYLESNN